MHSAAILLFYSELSSRSAASRKKYYKYIIKTKVKMTGKRRHPIIEDSSEDSDFSYDNSSNAASHTGSVEASELQPRKRGRGPSKRPCLNRNALMARANRQKKKEYVEHIESKLMHYRQEIKELTTKNQKQCIDLKRLTAEVSYLKNILNNNSSITSLLKSMNEILARGRRKSKGEASSKSICHVKEKEAEKEKGLEAAPVLAWKFGILDNKIKLSCRVAEWILKLKY
ncbi:uncharacterized protein LOC141527929 isoform X2 [Cotesia typhae]|uniref:uncharacterized protein LOC141527929 isoform X2 n=1 Tax=Cotesia typhae TaxID=2053667 RepID=UPI003D69AE3C